MPADYDQVVEGAASADPLEFARVLAAALAEYSASASVRGGAQPLPPAEKQRRDAAKVEYEALLAEYDEQGITPRYRVGGTDPGGFFIDDVLYPIGSELEYPGQLNPQLEPLNTPARRLHSLYMASIGGITDLGEEAYNAYANRPRQATIVGSRNEPPPLGTPRSVSRARVVDGAQPDLPEPPPAQNGMDGGSILHPQRKGRYPTMPEPA